MQSGADSPTVRISLQAHELLRRLAQEEQKSMQNILAKALEGYRREMFLRGAHTDYETLKRDPDAWKQELHERSGWDQTLPDGLDKEDSGSEGLDQHAGMFGI